MTVSPWAYAAGAAVVAVGGLVLAAKSSPAATPPGPTPNNPAVPIAIVSGHRYEVTLTFGSPTTAAALLSTVVANLQTGLTAVAPNVYSVVHASAPNNQQVVYVVDAVRPPPGSTWNESPQTFQADLNAAAVGGLTVAVLDLGPSPVGAPGPNTPILAPGPLSPTTPLTDPGLVTMAQSALAALAAVGLFTSSPPVAVNGNPQDPATVAAAAAFQAQNPRLGSSSGVLDYVTFGAAVVSALLHTGDASKLGSDATLTDGPTLTLAQGRLAVAIGLGAFPSIDYGAAQVSGSPSDAAWVAAWKIAAGQFNTNLGKSVLPVDGSLDRIGLGVLLALAALPPVLPDGTPIATPATPVTLPEEISIAQAALQQLASINAAFNGVTINGQLDAATATALTAYQAAQPGLQHRASPGVLDTLTLASLRAQALTQSYSSSTGTFPTPLPVASGPALTRTALVGAVQEAVALLSTGRLAPAGASYAQQPDGNAANPAFVQALKTLIAFLNTNSGPHIGFALVATGALDYNIFSNLYVVAYM